MGLFFEKASKQSKMQRMATNLFTVFFILMILNNTLLDWPWFKIITPYGLGLFIFVFLMFGLRKVKHENNPDA